MPLRSTRLKDEDVGADEYLAHAESLRAAATDDAEGLEADEQVELSRTCAQYQTLMARLGQIDFGDQIVEVLRLLRTRPHALRRSQQRYRFILVRSEEHTSELHSLHTRRSSDLLAWARSTSATRSWRCSVSCARAPTCSGAASSGTASSSWTSSRTPHTPSSRR